MEERDRPYYVELVRGLAAVDSWVNRIDPGANRQSAVPGSPLRADDDRTHPYELSHGAWHSLSHAVDHLHCLRSLVRDARVIHMYAPYSLIRAALENACAAVWMLSPSNRSERVTRRLRLAAVDIRNGEQAKELMGTVGPRSLEDRLGELKGKESASRARTAKIVLSGIMRYAARHGAVAFNPIREVARIESTPTRPPRALSVVERQAWLEGVETDDQARSWDLPDLTRMMLATGCRVGECLAIGWTEVDLDNATVEIRWRLVRRTAVHQDRRQGRAPGPAPGLGRGHAAASARCHRRGRRPGVPRLLGWLAGPVERASCVA